MSRLCTCLVRKKVERKARRLKPNQSQQRLEEGAIVIMSQEGNLKQLQMAAQAVLVSKLYLTLR